MVTGGGALQIAPLRLFEREESDEVVVRREFHAQYLTQKLLATAPLSSRSQSEQRAPSQAEKMTKAAALGPLSAILERRAPELFQDPEEAQAGLELIKEAHGILRRFLPYLTVQDVTQ